MMTTTTATTTAPRPISAAKAELESLTQLFQDYGPSLDEGRYAELCRRISVCRAEIAAAGEAA